MIFTFSSVFHLTIRANILMLFAFTLSLSLEFLYSAILSTILLVLQDILQLVFLNNFVMNWFLNQNM